MKKWLKFIYVFLVIGLESLGNMSAVTTVIEENLIRKNKWITEEDLMDSITMARLGPGATTANMVAFLGNHIGGFGGGLVAAICYTIIPLIIIVCTIKIIDKIGDYPIAMSALRGSLACVFAMFIYSTFELGKKLLNSMVNRIVFIASLILAIFFNISGIWIILGGIVCGIIIYRKYSN